MEERKRAYHLVRYALTPRRLEAARENLAKAQAARKAHHYPYRMSPKRLAAALANLRKANASPASRGNTFRHGLYCVSLGRSLARAGESREEFEMCLKLFARAFAPWRGDAGPRRAARREDARLVRAAAEATWRRLRVFRGLALWEARNLRRLLEAPAHSETLTAARAVLLACRMLEIFLDHATTFKCLDKLNRRLEDVFHTLLGRRYGRVPRLGVLRLTRHKRADLKGKPPCVINNPLRPAWVVVKRQARKLRPQNQPAPVGKDESARRNGETLDDYLRFFQGAFVPADADADLQNLARAAAEAAWARSQCFTQRAGLEVQRLAAILHVAVTLSPLARRQTHSLARFLLSAFADAEPVFRSVANHNERLRDLLRELLTKRYGSRPDFEFLVRRPSSDE